MSEPTPEQIQQFDAASEKALENVKEALNATDWKELKRDGDTIFYSRSVPSSSFSMIKSETTISLPFDVVAKELYTCPDIKPEQPANERDGVIERTLYPVCGDRTYDEGLLYLALESPSKLVSPRDFVMYRKHYLIDGVHYFTQCSVDSNIREENKKYVRGSILFQSFVVDNDPNSDAVRVRFVVHADPKGKIPALIYNAVASSQGYAVKKLKDGLLEKNK